MLKKFLSLLVVLTVMASATPSHAFLQKGIMFAGAGVPSIPANVSAPVVSGAVIVGQTLNCSTGGWTGNPFPTYTYKWRKNAVDISGATSSSWVVDSANVAGPIDCVVTATNSQGSTSQDSADLTTFTPNTIGTVLAWYDPSDTASITDAGGGAVSQINDKSGNGYHATQGTAGRRPITGTQTINSLNALDFDGVVGGTTADTLVLPSGVYTVSSGNNTVFVIAKTDVSTSGNHFMLYNSNSGSGFYQLAMGGSNTTLNYSSSNAYNFSTSTISGDTNVHVWGGIRNGTSMRSFYDGVLGPNNTSASNTTTTAAFIGADNFGGQTWDGKVGEIVIFTKALSTQEMNWMGAYLAYKWGFTWTTM